jgi:3-oxoacyl-[acyl-carrier protein] reductase
MIDLTGQTAIITGGSRGVGAASARLLAEAGADVVVTYAAHAKAARSVVASVEERGRRAIAMQVRVERPADCTRAVRLAAKAFGRIDILVNSAGIWEYGELGRMNLDSWRRTMRVNLDGTFNMCSAVIPGMKRNEYGRIVNVSSTAAQRGEAFHSQYAASKGGILAFTKSAAAELAPFGIQVNCVAPGWVDTDMVAGVMKNSRKKEEILRSIPRGTVASADEIAGPILFLCSALSNHVIGEVLNINGGSVLCG